jgi:hypothetical protein
MDNRITTPTFQQLRESIFKFQQATQQPNPLRLIGENI